MRASLSSRLALAVAVFLAPRMASAQAYRADRASSEGPGFKVGRLVLHPGLSLEGGYDRNVFLQNVDPEDSFMLRLTGYLDVATLSEQRKREGEAAKAEPEKLTFRGGLGAAYYHFFNDRVRNNLAADAHFDLGYNPSTVFSLQFRDVFRRTVRPFSDPNTLVGETISYGRNINTASLDLVGRSRSAVLEGRVGYTNVIQFFDDPIYEYGNSLTHRVPASLSWAFFPTSALIWDFDYANQSYSDARFDPLVPTLVSDNNRASSRIGYNGAITETLSLTANIGYTFGFYEAGPDFDGVIARAEARWRPRPTISLTGGYVRSVLPSFIGNFTVMNRLFLNATFIAAGALTVGIRSWVSFDRSGLALSPDGSLLGTEPRREDIRVAARLFVEYRFKAWLAVFGKIGYLADFTDFQYVGLAPLPDPSADYQKVDAWVGIRVFY